MQIGYEKFVKKAIEGDRDAYGELYKIFVDKIYRFIYYLTGDEFLAEDITQNTFLKAWKSLPKFSLKKGTFQSFLYTIARNLVIDNARRKKEYSLQFDVPDEIESNEDLVLGVSKKDSMEKVRDALSNLDGIDRQIVIMRFFEEMHFDEVAKVLGKKPGAIRVRIHRVLGVMKKDLEGRL